MNLKIWMKKFKDLNCTLCGEPIVIAGKEAITFENPRHQRCDNVITQKNKVVAEPVFEDVEVLPLQPAFPASPVEVKEESISKFDMEGVDGK